jgi:heme oxygenase
VGNAQAPTQAHIELREGTRDAHEAAEATDGMRRLMAGELDEGGYEGLLRAQLGLFDGWETERGDWLAAAAGVAGWSYVSRAALLRSDLAFARRAGSYKGGSVPVIRQADAGGRPAGVPAHDSATCWGELYVIEGSALGGRLIVRRLRELYPERIHRFYAIGEDAPSAWRRFQQILDTNLPDAASCRAAVEGAQHMFARFRQVLKDPHAHV